MDIKLLVAVGDGEVLSLTISQGMWIENNSQAHWEIDGLIDCAMAKAWQEMQESEDYQRWLDSGWTADDWQEAS